MSCVVSVFDGERFLAQAIDGLLAQTYRPLQVVVVDDGSRDGSARVARGYGERLVEVVEVPHRGLAAARNAGLARARGELVGFPDADDLWRPEKVARQVDHFRARPGLDVSATEHRNFLEPGHAPLPAWRLRYLEMEARGEALIATILARRGVVDRLGGFDEAFVGCGEDIDWLLRLREAGATVERLPEPLVDRRLHDGNLTGGFDDEARLEVLAAVLTRRRARIEAGRRAASPPAEQHEGEP